MLVGLQLFFEFSELVFLQVNYLLLIPALNLEIYNGLVFVAEYVE